MIRPSVGLTRQASHSRGGPRLPAKPGHGRRANGAWSEPPRWCVWPRHHLPPAKTLFWLRSPSGLRKHQSLRL